MVVSEADNAPPALLELEKAFNDHRAFDILLTDLHMPDMDGYSLARAITWNPAISAIPRLLLSSGSLGTEADRSKLGFAQTLLKPVRQAHLFDAIASALQAPGHKVAVPAKIQEDLLDYSGKRILVVEDNQVNQKVILAMLAKFHCMPDLAENGQEALDKLAQQTYDLVLMDCQMPVMDGYETTRILRGQELTQQSTRIPVVALTAHASSDEREKCLSAGMDDFLSKPIARPALAKMLARWLGETAQSEAEANQDETEVITDILAQFPIWDEAEALKRLEADCELLGDMIDVFLEDIPARLMDLEEASVHNDLSALADAAHAIKGMAGHFCAGQLINHAANLENSARNGQSADFQAMAKNVADAAASLINALAQKQRTQP